LCINSLGRSCALLLDRWGRIRNPGVIVMITPKPVESYVLPPDLVAFAILVRNWYGVVMVLLKV
jgi:hypothetical protein